MTYIDFPARIARFQEKMKEAGVDVLVGTRLKTITHLSGGFVPWRSCLVVPAEGQLQLITGVLDAGRLLDESWLDNVVGYGALPGLQFLDLIAQRITELGCAKGTVGVESGTSNYLPEGYITQYEYEGLSGKLPEAPWSRSRKR